MSVGLDIQRANTARRLAMQALFKAANIAYIKDATLTKIFGGWRITTGSNTGFSGMGNQRSFTVMDSIQSPAPVKAITVRLPTAVLPAVTVGTRTVQQAITTSSTQTTFQDTQQSIQSYSLPYIHKKEVLVKATGLRPFANLVVKFDGTDVTMLVEPLTEANYIADATGVPANIGAQLKVDIAGNAWFRFYIPAAKFTTGVKVIHISDNLDELLESTSAETVFSTAGTFSLMQPMRTFSSKTITTTSYKSVTQSYTLPVTPAPVAPAPTKQIGYKMVNYDGRFFQVAI